MRVISAVFLALALAVSSAQEDVDRGTPEEDQDNRAPEEGGEPCDCAAVAVEESASALASVAAQKSELASLTTDLRNVRGGAHACDVELQNIKVATSGNSETRHEFELLKHLVENLKIKVNDDLGGVEQELKETKAAIITYADQEEETTKVRLPEIEKTTKKRDEILQYVHEKQADLTMLTQEIEDFMDAPDPMINYDLITEDIYSMWESLVGSSGGAGPEEETE